MPVWQEEEETLLPEDDKSVSDLEDEMEWVSSIESDSELRVLELSVSLGVIEVSAEIEEESMLHGFVEPVSELIDAQLSVFLREDTIEGVSWQAWPMSCV